MLNFILEEWMSRYTEWYTVYGLAVIALKVARYSSSGSIAPKFVYKLRRHKQSFEKIDTTVVLDKDENVV